MRVSCSLGFAPEKERLGSLVESSVGRRSKCCGDYPRSSCLGQLGGIESFLVESAQRSIVCLVPQMIATEDLESLARLSLMKPGGLVECG
jgi:hypothetical protein